MISHFHYSFPKKHLHRIRHAPAPDLFRLDGRVALVTGAGGRLGTSMCIGLAEAGAHVILNGRRANSLEQLCQDIRSRGYTAEVCAFDVTDRTAVTNAVRTLTSRHDRLDVLINNAYAGKTGTMDTADDDAFSQAYAVAVTAAFRLTMAVQELLVSAVRHAGHASVINISSMYGTHSPDPAIYGSSGMNNPPSYGAAKAGLLQLTRYSACHLAPLGIRVNAVCPGPFPPPDLLQQFPDFQVNLKKRVPLGRIGHPEELKGTVLFLASDASSFVTGASLPVDGGWTAW